MLFLYSAGEIYNYKLIGQEHDYSLRTGSDCEVLLPLYHTVEGDTIAFARSLDGVFAIILVDLVRKIVVVARDPYGVRPLFTGKLVSPSDPTVFSTVFASEIKGIVPAGEVIDIHPFPPGTVRTYDIDTGSLLSSTQYHAIPWLKNPSYSATPEGRKLATSAIKEAFTTAVQKRLLSDRPVGALLSGGLDSSLVAALAARGLKESPLANGDNEIKRLHTFSIGMSGSPDLIAARAVANHIHSIHHEIVAEEEDFLNAIPEVIATIESYDITSVRASVGNYLVSKYIAANTDIKVVFNGDGADEASGSYLYFYSAPSPTAFEHEVNRLLQDIHYFDVLRSDRSVSNHGLEARTPFLDRQFMMVYLSIHTALRQPRRPVTDTHGTEIDNGVAEKQLLREAFDDPTDPLLPSEVLWRRKEAFSDGVSHPGRSWHSVIAEHVQNIYPNDTEWQQSCKEYTGVTAPYTRESLWYRKLFEKYYGTKNSNVIPYFWLPRWSGNAKDPSARTLAVYNGNNSPNSSTATNSDNFTNNNTMTNITINNTPSTSSSNPSSPLVTGKTTPPSGRSPRRTAGHNPIIPTFTSLSPDPDGSKLWEKVTKTSGC